MIVNLVLYYSENVTTTARMYKPYLLLYQIPNGWIEIRLTRLRNVSPYEFPKLM
jgi:hypothetical protein